MYKKKYGQNFLINNDLSKKIVSSLNIYNKCILEIGTGNMALTKLIIDEKPKNFISLEIDKSIVEKIYSNEKIIKNYIKNIDVNNCDETSFFKEKFSIISNLPYNISSQLLLKWTHLECFKNCLQEMVLMFQQELGERIIAKKNTKKFGKISVLVQSIFLVEKVFIVEKKFFFPQPKVNGIVLKFTPLKNKKITKENYNNLTKITTLLFSNRRKKNIKKIKSIFNEFDIKKNSLNNFFNLRAENIDVDDFCKMASLI